MERKESFRRHAELVSASIVPHGLEAKSDRKIDPFRIIALDQIDLPLPVPALELLFPQDRTLHIAEHFLADKHVNSILPGKARHGIGAMLMQSGDEVRRDTYVKHPVWPAREDVDTRLPIHRVEPAEKWMLKQVQHDDLEKLRD